jgi:hypothetical protein
MLKTDNRIIECRRVPQDRENNFKSIRNMMHGTGSIYLDYSQHELKSALEHLNLQHHDHYIAIKPDNNTVSLNGFPLIGHALVENSGSVLFLCGGQYRSLTNTALASAVRKA